MPGTGFGLSRHGVCEDYACASALMTLSRLPATTLPLNVEGADGRQALCTG